MAESLLSKDGPKKSQSTLSRVLSTWSKIALSLAALGLFAVVVVLVQGTYLAMRLSAEGAALSPFLKTDVSKTLAVVRISQGLLSVIMTALMNGMFVLLQWNLMASPNGLSYRDLLALSPTTDMLGGLAVLRSPRFWLRSSAKMWLLIRLSFSGILWLSGLALFLNTSFVTVYDTAHTQKATAGVGPFNASLIDPFIHRLQDPTPAYPYQVVPFTYFAAVYILVVNPLISTIAEPVQCSTGGKCVSYLLSGGLSMVAPWTGSGYDDHSMVRIHRTPSIQFDFSSPASDTFAETDCDDFGKTGFNIGIRLCVASQPDDTGFRVGLFVCKNGTDNSACSPSSLPTTANITTNISFYTRTATVIAARSNFSIISIEQTSPPTLLNPSTSIPIHSYRESLRWLLNFTASDIPPPTSIAQSFWSSRRQLSDPSTYGVLEQNFHSIIAFPFWLFNSNNWGNIDLQPDVLNDNLPDGFYTTASLVEPVVKITFDERMFWLFVGLQAVAMVFIWGVLGWVWFGAGRKQPAGKEKQSEAKVEISSFPLFDMVFRARVAGKVTEEEVSEQELMNANDKGILDIVKDSLVYHGNGTLRARKKDLKRDLKTVGEEDSISCSEGTKRYCTV